MHHRHLGCVFGKWLAHKSRIILQQGYKNRWENSPVKKTKQTDETVAGLRGSKGQARFLSQILFSVMLVEILGNR